MKINKYIIFSLFGILFLFFVFYLTNFNEENSIDFSKMEKSVILGNSMNPTLKNGDIAYLDRNYINYKQGDIVAFKLQSKEDIYVKRIIAMESDNIVFGKDGKIYVNNEVLDEIYVKDVSFSVSNLKLLLKQLEYYNNTIPKGYVLILGDNRAYSYDSSEYGFISKEYLIGKVYILDK